MESTIWITPLSNTKNGQIIKYEKIKELTYDSDMDVLKFEKKKNGKNWRGNLMHVSLYDDYLIRREKKKDVKYIILRMVSKS